MPNEKPNSRYNGNGIRATGREFILYTGASFIALVVDYTTYWLLASAFGVDIGLAAVLGYSLGLVVSYFLLTRRVFSSRRLAHRRGLEIVLFCVSGLIGLVLTYATVTVLRQMTRADLHSMKVAAIVASFISVYLFRKLVVFAPVEFTRMNEET